VIKIEHYTLADLAERVRSDDFWQGEVCPITKHRALSHIKNPRATPEDVALLVAYDESRVVAYMGILPDLVFLNGGRERIGWLTAWWADPDPKYGGIGLVLMTKGLHYYRGEVGASGISDDARKVYEASKQFVTFAESCRMKAFLRSNTRELIPPKVPILKRAKWFLAIYDVLINIVCNLRLQLWKWRFGIGETLRVEYIAEVDSQTANFIAQFQCHEISRRGASEINWIAQHPWVLAAPIAKGREGAFRFSTTAKQSICLMLKIFSVDNTMIGFAMLRLIDGNLTVPFCYMPKECGDQMFRVIGEHAVALRAYTLTICRTELRESLTRLKFPCIARIKKTRSWIGGIVYKAKIQGELEMQDGDGDCAFA
jgi:hypothetical protein